MCWLSLNLDEFFLRWKWKYVSTLCKVEQCLTSILPKWNHLGSLQNTCLAEGFQTHRKPGRCWRVTNLQWIGTILPLFKTKEPNRALLGISGLTLYLVLWFLSRIFRSYLDYLIAALVNYLLLESYIELEWCFGLSGGKRLEFIYSRCLLHLKFDCWS